MMWLWLDLLFFSLFVDGALFVKWLLDAEFPLPTARPEAFRG